MPAAAAWGHAALATAPSRQSAAAALRIWTETAKTSRHTPPAGVYGEGSPVPQQGAAGAAAAAAAALRAGLRLGLAPRLRLRLGRRLRPIFWINLPRTTGATPARQLEAAAPPSAPAAKAAPSTLAAALVLLLALAAGAYTALAPGKLKSVTKLGPGAFDGLDLKLSGGHTGVAMVGFTCAAALCFSCPLLHAAR